MSTVIIGCKLPNGFRMSVKVNGKLFETRINGYNQQIIDGGHGITRDIPADAWKAWLSLNKDSQMVKNGFVFAHAKEADVKEESKDKKGNKTKLEQMPQSTTIEGTKVEKG